MLNPTPRKGLRGVVRKWGRLEEGLGQEWDHSVPSSSSCQALFDRILINNGGGGVSKPRLKENQDGSPSITVSALSRDTTSGRRFCFFPSWKRFCFSLALLLPQGSRLRIRRWN